MVPRPHAAPRDALTAPRRLSRSASESTLPCRMASTTASTFECTPSLVRMFAVCVRTVAWLIPSLSATACESRPSAISCRISVSPGREPCHPLPLRFLDGSPAAQAALQAVDLLLVEQRLAALGLADGVDQLVHRADLREVAARARLHGAGLEQVVVVRRQHDDLHAGCGLQDAARRLQAAHARHGDVHQDHVGRVAADDSSASSPLQRRVDGQPPLRGHRSADGLGDGSVVVHHQDGDPFPRLWSPCRAAMLHPGRGPCPATREGAARCR